jgi:hypothetical protein
VTYGFGYFGSGYEGGYWRDRHFYYNRTVNNVNITTVHIYNKTVINNVTVNRISYNGGRGGIKAHPTREQEMWGHEHHFEATNLQRNHERDAGHKRGFLASENHGRPGIAATSRPGEFHGPKVVPAREERVPFSRPEIHQTPRPERARSNDRPMPRGKRCTVGAHRSRTTTLVARHARAPATIVRKTPVHATTAVAMRTRLRLRTATEVRTRAQLTKRERAIPVAGARNGHSSDNQR